MMQQSHYPHIIFCVPAWYVRSLGWVLSTLSYLLLVCYASAAPLLTEVQNGKAIFDRYIETYYSTGHACRLVSKRSFSSTKLSGLQEGESITQVSDDGFMFQRTLDTIKDLQGRLLRRTLILQNRSGQWYLFPDLQCAVRIKKAWKPVLSGTQLDESYRVVPDFKTTIESGEPCYIIEAIKSGTTNDSELPNSEAGKKQSEIHLFYVSSRTFLPMKHVRLDPDRKPVTETAFVASEIVSLLEQAEFEVPTGYQLLIPATEDESKHFMLAAENRMTSKIMSK